MSHITCPKCGSNEHYEMYGLAAGGIGGYTVCECGEFLETFPDNESMRADRKATTNSPAGGIENAAEPSPYKR